MNKRTALALTLAILTMAASVYGAFTAITNTYQKPIREAEKIANAMISSKTGSVSGINITSDGENIIVEAI